MEHKCVNCGSEFDGNVCPECNTECAVVAPKRKWYAFWQIWSLAALITVIAVMSLTSFFIDIAKIESKGILKFFVSYADMLLAPFGAVGLWCLYISKIKNKKVVENVKLCRITFLWLIMFGALQWIVLMVLEMLGQTSNKVTVVLYVLAIAVGLVVAVAAILCFRMTSDVELLVEKKVNVARQTFLVFATMLAAMYAVMVGVVSAFKFVDKAYLEGVICLIKTVVAVYLLGLSGFYARKNAKEDVAHARYED